MGLTSALYTGLSGMNTNQLRIDVIGDNISNANTTGFKSSRSTFQTQFAQMFTMGTPPSNNQGGSNGVEVGLGSTVGATQRNMSQGSTETTGQATDMAIDGSGFFVVRGANNTQGYTRDGSFLLNATNQLVTADGSYLQGFGVDQNFKVIPGQVTDLQIPLGRLSAARATSSVQLSGNLDGKSGLTGVGSHYQSASPFVVDASGNPADSSTDLTALRGAAAGTAMFNKGDTIMLSGVTKGTWGTLPDAKFVVGTTGTTLGDFTNWLNGSLGIRTDTGQASAGASIDSNGFLVINGNPGTENGLTLNTSSITSSNSAMTQPIDFDSALTTPASGSSIHTTVQVYDSLGTPITVGVTAVLEDQTNGNKWRIYAESNGNVNGPDAIGTGTITFDSAGKVIAKTGLDCQIGRAGTGAADPLNFSLDLSSVGGLTGLTQSLVGTGQDGFGAGTLNSFSVGSDGTITGVFSNGLSRTLGQVAVATFSNPAGLTRQTNNLFSGGPNSGDPVISAPEVAGAGRIMSGALELSNVDLSREFIGLINASTGYSAASKVITTSNQLLNDLMQLTR